MRRVARSLCQVAAHHHLQTMPTADREGLTEPLVALREECKGQSLDLADMSDVARRVGQQFHTCVQTHPVEDPPFQGKVATLTASVKAYHTRLSNLQNEARSIQSEVDALLRLLWGTDQPPGAAAASFARPPPDDEAPMPRDAAPAVERVEGEVVGASSPSRPQGPASTTEIEVEAIEMDAEASPVPEETTSVADMTAYLYERGVDFADCLDAASLRVRYAEAQRAARAAASVESVSTNREQPRAPPRAEAYRPPAEAYRPPPSSPETGLANDPYPNAHRKLVDPSKFVWEIKKELAAEKSINPSTVDLWSGKVKLDDQRRLYDYPSVQSYPIEVRQKGDIPS